MQLKIKEQTFILLPQKAVYWKEKKTLIVSDLHLGKVSYFRKEGIPVPSAGIEKNFAKLDQILSEYDVTRIIFTGDLFHDSINEEWKKFKTWRENNSSLKMDIVMGNHDRLKISDYQSVSLAVYDCDLVVEPFTFCHHPQEKIKSNKYIICGHIHPVFCIHGIANQSMRLPCFYFGESQAVLPSFGYFTGGYEVKKITNERIFLVVENSVIEVPADK